MVNEFQSEMASKAQYQENESEELWTLADTRIQEAQDWFDHQLKQAKQTFSIEK